LTVNGSVFFAGDAFDGGVTANQAAIDLNTAWLQGKAMVDTQAGVLTGQIGGKTLIPGVYHEANLGFAAGTIATFDGQNAANPVFIIKVDGSMTDSGILVNRNSINLINGAQARNIWFVIDAGAMTIGHGTTWNGNILCGGTITINDSSTVLGRALGGAAGAGAVSLSGAPLPFVGGTSTLTVTVP
jgi:hypothetical protein